MCEKNRNEKNEAKSIAVERSGTSRRKISLGARVGVELQRKALGTLTLLILAVGQASGAGDITAVVDVCVGACGA